MLVKNFMAKTKSWIHHCWQANRVSEVGEIKANVYVIPLLGWVSLGFLAKQPCKIFNA